MNIKKYMSIPEYGFLTKLNFPQSISVIPASGFCFDLSFMLYTTLLKATRWSKHPAG
ncbi:MAG: hypothetical protein R6V36_07300 [Psychroflexus sp.]